MTPRKLPGSHIRSAIVLAAGMGLVVSLMPMSVSAQQTHDSSGKKVVINKNVGQASPQVLQSSVNNEALNPQPLPPKLSPPINQTVKVNSFGFPAATQPGTSGKTNSAGLPPVSGITSLPPGVTIPRDTGSKKQNGNNGKLNPCVPKGFDVTTTGTPCKGTP